MLDFWQTIETKLKKSEIEFLLNLLNIYFAKFNEHLGNILSRIEIVELYKRVHCVDLDESFQTHTYLHTLASIQPRTSLPKFA